MGFFEIFPLLFTLMFLLVLGVILSNLIRGVKQERKNNASPRLTVPATVVAKRDEMIRHYSSGANGVGHSSHSTRYYATFQFDSGDRMELQLQGFEYGMLVEGDRGNLSFQGTRFLSFERT